MEKIVDTSGILKKRFLALKNEKQNSNIVVQMNLNIGNSHRKQFNKNLRRFEST